MHNIAHRGASGSFPENTMLSYSKALEMGCTGIAADVQMTKDGFLVLMHDEMVNRTTDGIGLLKDYTLKELRKLDVVSLKTDNKKHKIPMVEELFDLVVNTNTILNLRLKTEIMCYEGIEKKLIDLIHKYSMVERTIISSYNHYSLVKCKNIDNNVKIGLLYSEALYKPQNYAEHIGAEAIHPSFYTLNRETVKEIKSSGILINVQVVNDISYMKYFIELGVDGIITDYPDRLERMLES